MLEELLQYEDLGLLLLRLAIGAIFINHSLPKVKNPAAMAAGMGFSANMVKGLGLVELLSALGLIFHIWLPLAALLLAAVMVGALYYKTQKWKVPFWGKDTTGWEFDLILLAANLVLLTVGGGTIGLQF